jgi:acyl-CoA hydrolase
MAPRVLELADLRLADWIRDGDGVVWGQACAESLPLVDKLLQQSPEIGALRGFCGMTWSTLLEQSTADTVQVVSYGALGRLARAAAVRPLEIVPCHLSALPRLFAARRLPVDVALVQLAPPDERGQCSLGAGVDYTADALPHCRAIVAEINAQMPRTRGASIPYERLDAVVRTDRPLIEPPRSTPSPVDEQVADRVAALIEDGDTIQIGVGSLPEAILARLRHLRELGVHSGMIADPIVELMEAGVITGEHKRVDRGLVVTGAALGRRRLYEHIDGHPGVCMMPVSYTHSAAVLARVGPLAAINSALEVDLLGQAGGEEIGGRPLGAVGGQVDFLRAAAAAPRGKPILALASRTARGEPRIVPRLSGPVSAARSDVDIVVTEHGVARLSGLTPPARAQALIAIAHPEDREVLERAAHDR